MPKKSSRRPSKRGSFAAITILPFVTWKLADVMRSHAIVSERDVERVARRCGAKSSDVADLKRLTPRQLLSFAVKLNTAAKKSEAATLREILS